MASQAIKHAIDLLEARFGFSYKNVDAWFWTVGEASNVMIAFLKR